MYYSLQAPEAISKTIALPSSKSISNRALIMNQLSGNDILLENLADCDDTQVMIRALGSLSKVTDIGAAGTAMRFLTAYFASTDNSTLLTGTERMRHRPIGILVDALLSLGTDISYAGEEGYPPLSIKGRRLKGGEMSIPGHISSQYISALMMIAPYTVNGLRMHLTGDIISKSYINLTEQLMRRFGADIEREDERTLTIRPSRYTGKSFTIENDWSAASYWYEILALLADKESCIMLPNLCANSLQGDAEVRKLFEPLGVNTTFKEGGILLTKGTERCREYNQDLSSQPDLAQAIVVTCAMLRIPFTITGLQTLRIKETDRMKALRMELAKTGVHIEERNSNTLTWNGTTEHTDNILPIDTYEDHRMAMAFAPCAICYPLLKINHPEVVSKSYPRFWEDLRQAGFKILQQSTLP